MSLNQAEFPIVIVSNPSHPQAAQPAQVADSGKLRIGGACRILPPATKPAQVADTGRIRMGGACRILPPGRGRA